MVMNKKCSAIAYNLLSVQYKEMLPREIKMNSTGGDCKKRIVLKIHLKQNRYMIDQMIQITAM